MKLRYLILLIIILASLRVNFGEEIYSVHREQEMMFGDTVFAHGATIRIPKEITALSHIVYGFVPYWERSYNCPRWDLISRIAYFNCTIGSDGSIINSHYWYSASVVDSALANGVPVDLCIAVFDDATINTIISNPTSRANCITNSISAMLSRGGTGINVDFEHPSSSYGDELVTFMAEFRESLDARGSGYWLSICLPSVDWRDNYFTDQLKFYCDAMFIMGYGYHWSGSPYTGSVDPLDDPSESYDLVYSVEHFSAQSGAPEKIILGLPAYGYDWPCDGPDKGAATTGSGSAIFYINAISNAESYGRLWDTESSSPWYRYNSWNQCWYSDSTSLALRYQYAKDSGLMGIGWWALGYDDGDPAFWGAVEQEFAMGDTVGIIVDDGDSGFNCNWDNWDTGAYPESGWDNDYLWAEITDTIYDWARWTPELPERAMYDVFMWWYAASNRCDSVLVRIMGIENDSVFISQKGSGAMWHYLGKFPFDADGTEYVGIKDETATNGTVIIADAVKFIYDQPIQDTIIVDNGDPEYSTGGSWNDGTYNPSAGWNDDYQYCSVGGELDWAHWTPQIHISGQYDVYMWWYAGSNRCDSVFVRINGLSDDTIFVSQQGSGSDWHYLGTFPFQSGNSGYVGIHDQTAVDGSVVIADAVMWIFAEPLSTPDELVTQKPTNIDIFAYPNPFNSSCVITAPSGAEVEIYDLRGNVVTPYSDGKPSSFVPLNKGDNEIAEQSSRGMTWLPDENISSGVYLIKATTKDGLTTTKRIIYLK